jgi:hypothetical protein
MKLSNWLYASTDATHRIALERLAVLVTKGLVEEGVDAEQAAAVVRSDYAGQANVKMKADAVAKIKADHAAPHRQARHLEVSSQ